MLKEKISTACILKTDKGKLFDLVVKYSEIHLPFCRHVGKREGPAGEFMRLKQSRRPICHLRNERGTGAEMRPAIVSGIIAWDAPARYWPMLLRN